MNTPPPSKRVRLTISVTPEVHATFQRLADATSQSLGMTMGEWLADTTEAAEHVAAMVERARAAPREVVREMHAYAQGLADETGDFMRSMTGKGIGRTAQVFGSGGVSARGARGGDAASPPASNTGGKVPGKGQPRGPRK